MLKIILFITVFIIIALTGCATKNDNYVNTFGVMWHFDLAFNHYSTSYEFAYWDDPLDKKEYFSSGINVGYETIAKDEYHSLNKFYFEYQIGVIYLGTSNGLYVTFHDYSQRIMDFGIQNTTWANFIGGIDLRTTFNFKEFNLYPGKYFTIPLMAPDIGKIYVGL